MTPEEVAQAAAELDQADPILILEWATEAAPPLALTSSFGVDSAVMLHMVSRLETQPDVLFIDTGYHFDETQQHGEQLCDRLGLSYRHIRPTLAVAEHESVSGQQYRSDPNACCASRKVAPLYSTLASYGGWVTGLRRSQTVSRGDSPVVALEHIDDHPILKIAPLAGWGNEDVVRYLDQWDLPRHPLYAQGYRSVGCWPCTAPSADDSNARAGRWTDFDAKTECGLHNRGETTDSASA